MSLFTKHCTFPRGSLLVSGVFFFSRLLVPWGQGAHLSLSLTVQTTSMFLLEKQPCRRGQQPFHPSRPWEVGETGGFHFRHYSSATSIQRHTATEQGTVLSSSPPLYSC